jgi:hypothetical protein
MQALVQCQCSGFSSRRQIQAGLIKKLAILARSSIVWIDYIGVVAMALEMSFAPRETRDFAAAQDFLPDPLHFYRGLVP